MTTDIVYTKFDDHDTFCDFVEENWRPHVKVQTPAMFDQNHYSLERNPNFTTWFNLRSIHDFYEMANSLHASVTNYMNYDFIDATYATKYQVGISDTGCETLYISFIVRNVKHDLEESE